MTSLLDQFMIEGRALVQEASDALLSLGQGGDDRTELGVIFRAFHTLKGSSGLFDARPMTRLLHEAEELLARTDEQTEIVGPALVDLLLTCLDQVAGWLDDLERDGVLPASADLAADTLIRQIGGQQDKTDDAAPALAVDRCLELITPAERQAALSLHRALPDSAIHLISYRPLPGCFFNGDDPLRLFRDLSGLAALHIDTDDAGPLDNLDPFTCTLSFMALVVGDDGWRDIFRLCGDQVRSAVLPASALATGGGQDAIAAILAEQALMLTVADAPPAGLAGRIAAAATVAANIMTHEGRDADKAMIIKAGRDALALNDAAPLLQALNSLGSGRDALPTPSSPAPAASMPRLLRVSEDRVDRLVRLSGELGLIQNHLGWLTRERGEDRELHQLGTSLERLTRELRAAVLSISMMPVGDVFQRFPRLVRDLSIRLGKPARLVMEGARTEAEKAVVELLPEPLLHLVRNALDHGIEVAATRKAAGKPETATITLRAFQQGGRLLVEVTDDGGGIDTAAIRRRAVARGLLSAAEAAALSETDALQLVFAPGLSTASTLSDLSGRGVGMDAVRAAVDKAGGGVTLRSTPCAGTTITLSLPLTLSSLRLLVVEVAGLRLGLPMDMVLETVRLPRGHINRMRGRDIFTWRDRVVPLVSLAGLLDLEAPPPAPEARVLLVEINGSPVGVEVDGLGERMDAVLRPMDGILAGLSAYLGTVLLGDGTVLLVIDLKGIVR